MPRYLLTIYQPDGPAPDAEVMARVGADLHRLNQDLRASGSWVFTGGLHGLLGDLGLAEDAVSDAFAAALQRWPESGPPPSPAGWIVTTARNRAIDHLQPLRGPPEGGRTVVVIFLGLT